MHTFDPDSPREHGIDVNGNRVELGDHDSSGFFVGYIDEAGTVWESRRERDAALVAGRYVDAWRRWNKTGGVLGVEPQPHDFFEQVGCSPENEDEAARECAEHLEFMFVIEPHVADRRRRAASLN